MVANSKQSGQKFQWATFGCVVRKPLLLKAVFHKHTVDNKCSSDQSPPEKKITYLGSPIPDILSSISYEVDSGPKPKKIVGSNY